MKWVFDDGGRAAAGYEGKAGDCVCRAIAIATKLPYQEVYDLLKEAAQREYITKRRPKRSSVRDGVRRSTIDRVLPDLNCTWTPTMLVGQGCKVHLKDGELPSGRLIISLSKHFCAVIDGVIHDTYDPSRNETRCVYGYWKVKE